MVNRFGQLVFWSQYQYRRIRNQIPTALPPARRLSGECNRVAERSGFDPIFRVVVLTPENVEAKSMIKSRREESEQITTALTGPAAFACPDDPDASFQLYSRRLDDARPLRDLGAQEAVELGGGVADRRRALLLRPLADRRQGERFPDFAVQLGDDRGRRAGRREEAKPAD